jgi:spermidine synthase
MRFAFLVVFFVSGFAALLYQIIWQRMLTFFGGADVYSVTIIVSAFMGGLGFGSLAGGHLADRLTARGRMIAFATCELAVGLFATFSADIYYDLLYVRLGAWALPRPALAATIFAVTLWPTFFMGMSLPLAATALTQDARQPARWVPLLYGWNTIGAACGSLVAAGILFRTFDFVTDVRLGAILSFSCAIGALLASPFIVRRWSPHAALPDTSSFSTVSSTSSSISSSTHPPTHIRLGAWIAIYAVSGFVALSLEIVWFRVLGVLMKSNSFTFGHLLGVYLAGVGLGALIANTRPMRAWRPAPAFFLLQAAIPIVAAIALVLFVASIDRLTIGSALWEYLGQYEALTRDDRSGMVIFTGLTDSLIGGRPRLFITLYVLLPLWLLGLPTLMMGLSFGHLQRAVQTDLAALGRRVGWLQTANIVGCMTGAMLTGLLLLDWLGSAGTLRLLVCCSALFLFLFVHTQTNRARLTSFAGCALAIIAMVWLIPSASTFWARLHAATPEQIIEEEDGSGLSVLKEKLKENVNDPPPMAQRQKDEVVVYANGLGQSTLPYGGVHTVLGAWPAMLHERPESVAVIGLGSGDTLFAIGGRPETRVIESIEIIAPELDTLRRLDRHRTYPALRLLLHDHRVQHWFTDGRAFLRKRPQRYDIIEADALRPMSAYAGNLYSVEYFELLRDRLNPGGMAVTWAPTARVIDSVIKAFPHVLIFKDLAIGSTTPLSFDRSAIRARLQHAFTREYYQRGDIAIETLLAPYLADTPRVYGPEFNRDTLVDVNRDLFPKDEFAIPRATHGLP